MGGKLKSLLPRIAIGVCAIIILAVCLHSLEEIHYLKSFYPGKFSVQEAFYASGVEFFKILIISFPLVVIIFVSLAYLKTDRNKD